MIIASVVLQTKAQDASTEDTTPIPYFFTPPSGEYCDNNKLGSDTYVSLFSPCVFTFYKSSSNSSSTNSTGGHFSCDGIANSTNYEVIASDLSRVVAWPDACVANGPRCYDLAQHPNLANYTEFGTDKYYSLEFPSDASYVSVDCSHDFEIAEEAFKNLPEELEPLAHAIIFFGIMVLTGVIIICGMCCCFCGGGGRRRGYTKVGGIYAGPPVEAKKFTV